MNSTRWIRLVLAVAVYAVAGWALRGYITDDTFIHLRYAENLLHHGEFSFNPGQSSYGATSPLWIFGLAMLLKLGLSPFVAAGVLGEPRGCWRWCSWSGYSIALLFSRSTKQFYW